MSYDTPDTAAGRRIELEEAMRPSVGPTATTRSDCSPGLSAGRGCSLRLLLHPVQDPHHAGPVPLGGGHRQLAHELRRLGRPGGGVDPIPLGAGEAEREHHELFSVPIGGGRGYPRKPEEVKKTLDELAKRVDSMAWQFLPLERLEENHVIQRCGLTPTDVLHGSLSRP